VWARETISRERIGNRSIIRAAYLRLDCVLPSDTRDHLQRNTRGDPLALPPPHRPDLEDLLHQQVMRTAIDTAVSLGDAAEANEEPLMRLRRDVAVARGQRRIAHQQQGLLRVAGDERSWIVADVEAAHLDRLPAG